MPSPARNWRAVERKRIWSRTSSALTVKRPPRPSKILVPPLFASCRRRATHERMTAASEAQKDSHRPRRLFRDAQDQRIAPETPITEATNSSSEAANDGGARRSSKIFGSYSSRASLSENSSEASQAEKHPRAHGGLGFPR